MTQRQTSSTSSGTDKNKQTSSRSQGPSGSSSRSFRDDDRSSRDRDRSSGSREHDSNANKGFASMPKEQVQEIASKGGQASHGGNQGSSRTSRDRADEDRSSSGNRNESSSR